MDFNIRSDRLQWRIARVMLISDYEKSGYFDKYRERANEGVALFMQNFRIARFLNRAVRSTALVLLVMSEIGPALAQSADYRCPAVGTKFKFSSGGQLEALGETSPLTCRFKDLRNGQTFERLLAAFVPTSAAVKANLAKFSSLHPMQVGKTFNYQTSGASNLGGAGDWLHTWSIERAENLATPFGNVPTFVFFGVEQTFQGNGRWERRYWVAPSIGYAVKFEFKTVHGNPPPNYPKDWHLVEVTKP